jgi:hypothetical protein
MGVGRVVKRRRRQSGERRRGGGKGLNEEATNLDTRSGLRVEDEVSAKEVAYRKGGSAPGTVKRRRDEKKTNREAKPTPDLGGSSIPWRCACPTNHPRRKVSISSVPLEKRK